jgi:hypothetical protein
MTRTRSGTELENGGGEYLVRRIRLFERSDLRSALSASLADGPLRKPARSLRGSAS